jgi:uncharacterized membrane protein
MLFLDIFTITSAGLMIGNELAVSLFVNPALWQLENGAQAKALSLLARSLGKRMPGWYALCLILIVIEIYLHRNDAGLIPLLLAALLWIAVVICTIAFLVPINNCIAVLTSASSPPDWKPDHKRWDTLHRWRILVLVAALVSLIYGLVGARQTPDSTQVTAFQAQLSAQGDRNITSCIPHPECVIIHRSE